MTRRVVITGMGIVSCLGNNVEEVTASLKTQKSGIQIDPSYQDRGFRSHLAGNISLPESMLPPKKHARFMGDAALYSYIAMQQAIASAKLTPEMLSKRTTGLIVGSGGGSNDNIIDANEQLGFDADERIYLPAAEILKLLEVEQVRLMTNNPQKVSALEDGGVSVVERVPHAFASNRHNERYLATKQSRSGHLL